MSAIKRDGDRDLCEDDLPRDLVKRISASQANRIQALTGMSITAVATESAKKAQKSNDKKKKKKKKKPRHKKMMKKAKLVEEEEEERDDDDSHPQSEQDNAHADAANNNSNIAASGRRPGKKRMRKMKYLQSQLCSSPIDHLLFSAQNAIFTRSVTLVPSSLNEAKLHDGAENGTAAACSSPFGKVGNRTVPVRTTTSDVLASTVVSTTERRTIQQPHITVQPLLVLDLNGILCHRIRKNRIPANLLDPKKAAYRPIACNIANTPVIPRTDIKEFLHFLDQHFCLAVWTSAKKKTAQTLVHQLFPTDVANRLLFVWAQHDCDTTVDNKNNKKKDGGGGHHHHEDVVFVKDLSKVWKQYPLWNSNNTIIMDDSPDKCTQWHENAIHPPPLHGLLEDQAAALVSAGSLQQQHQQPQQQLLLSDEENERRQRVFFESLIQYWQNHSITATFDEECGDAITKIQQQQQDRSSSPADDADAPRGALNGDDSKKGSLLEYLKIHAVGHMGWE